MPDAQPSLPQKILNAIDEAVTLRISTVVVTNAGEKSMISTIDMAQGDIETKLSEEFVGDGPYSSLRAFHQKREAEGDQIVKGNVAALLELLGLFKQTKAAAEQPNG